MAAEVKRTATRFLAEDAESRISQAYTALTGDPPNALVGLYTLCLAWIESGAGDKAYNWNVGGITCYPDGKDPSWKGDWFRPSWWYEGIPSEEVAGRPTAFRSYSTSIDGWRDFVRTVLSRPSLIYAANADDPDLFVRELVSTGYSPDYGPQHVTAVRNLIADFKQGGFFGWEPEPSTEPEPSDDPTSLPDSSPVGKPPAATKPPTAATRRSGTSGAVWLMVGLSTAGCIWLLTRKWGRK